MVSAAKETKITGKPAGPVASPRRRNRLTAERHCTKSIAYAQPIPIADAIMARAKVDGSGTLIRLISYRCRRLTYDVDVEGLIRRAESPRF